MSQHMTVGGLAIASVLTIEIVAVMWLLYAKASPMVRAAAQAQSLAAKVAEMEHPAPVYVDWQVPPDAEEFEPGRVEGMMSVRIRTAQIGKMRYVALDEVLTLVEKFEETGGTMRDLVRMLRGLYGVSVGAGSHPHPPSDLEGDGG